MTVKPVFSDIFKSYNLAIQEKCEQSMGSVKSPSDYESLINEARYEWEGKQINGLLPVHAFETIENEKEFEEVFQMASLTCDEFIPDSFIKWILASDYMKSIENHAFSNPHIDIKNTSVRILGLSGNLEYSEGLIRLLYSEGEYEELIKETSRNALIAIGEKAIPYLKNELESKDILSDDDFHLVIALIGIDSSHRDESVFKMLKDSFRKTSDKALAARCLADYGDGRAVAMLRSYLEKNLKKLDENTIFELQGAVLSLGGSTEGLETN